MLTASTNDATVIAVEVVEVLVVVVEVVLVVVLVQISSTPSINMIF